MSGRINLDNMSEDFKSYIQSLESKIEHNMIVNVKDFGDNFTEALHNALNYIRENQIAINDFSSEDVNCITYCLKIPGGNYEYNGDGLSLNDLTNLKFIGDGYNITRIKITKEVYLLSSSKVLTYLEISGIKFAGGKGVFGHTYTGTNVCSGVYIHDNYFYGYTGCAIGSMSVDYPYWTIENNVFYGTETSIGIATPAGSDCSSISKNKFLCNKFHIKLRGGIGCKIKNNDFIRFTSSFDMNDIWLVPVGSLTGKDLVISENKFGNENLTPNAKRILIANDEGEYINSIVHSENTTDFKVAGSIIDRNSFSGGNYESIIHSYTLNLRDNYFNFILNGTFPKYLVYFEGDIDNQGYVYQVNNLIELNQSYEIMTQKLPIISNVPIFRVNDLFGYYDNYARNLNRSSNKDVEHLIDNSKTIKNIAQSLGGSYFENLQNKFGFDDTAIKVIGYGFKFDVSLKSNKKVNISFMCKSDIENDFTVCFYDTDGSRLLYKQFCKSYTDWSTINIEYTPLLDVTVRVEFTPCNEMVFSDLSCYTGNKKVINDISSNCCIDLQPINIENTITNYGRLFFDGRDIKFILPDGTIKKVQLID